MTSHGFKIADKDSGIAVQMDQGNAEITVVYAPHSASLALTATLRANDATVRHKLEELCASATDPNRNTETSALLSQIATRAGTSLKVASLPLHRSLEWLVSSRENTNFTYDLSPLNMSHLAATLSIVTGCPSAEIKRYLYEPSVDEALKAHYKTAHSAQPPQRRAIADDIARWGRRICWYAAARALKPRCIVETGVDKGHGALLLCAALQRNAAEGIEGTYIGTDINPNAGYLLAGPYARHGKILYGDSLNSLRTLTNPIDLFINDSDHSAEYEADEYRTIQPLLHDTSVVIGDNAHVTNVLLEFAHDTGRRFLFFREAPIHHWYPGAGIGLAFR